MKRNIGLFEAFLRTMAGFMLFGKGVGWKSNLADASHRHHAFLPVLSDVRQIHLRYAVGVCEKYGE